MSKDKHKEKEEPLPEPIIQTDEDFDAFIALCEADVGWDLCFDEKGILQSIVLLLFTSPSFILFVIVWCHDKHLIM